jgi:hypothetical protein
MRANPLCKELRSAFPPTPIVAADAFKQRGMFYCDATEYRAVRRQRWRVLGPIPHATAA